MTTTYRDITRKVREGNYTHEDVEALLDLAERACLICYTAKRRADQTIDWNQFWEVASSNESGSTKYSYDNVFAIGARLRGTLGGRLTLPFKEVPDV